MALIFVAKGETRSIKYIKRNREGDIEHLKWPCEGKAVFFFFD